eukprot:403331915
MQENSQKMRKLITEFSLDSRKMYVGNSQLLYLQETLNVGVWIPQETQYFTLQEDVTVPCVMNMITLFHFQKEG